MSKMTRAAVIGIVVAAAVSSGLSFWMASIGAQSSATTWILGAILGAFTFYILANLSGNKKAVYADPAQHAAAVSMTPPPGQGLLVAFREGFVAKAAGMNVSVDGREIAQLKAPRFTAVALPPGSHTLHVAFGGLAGAQNTPADLTFALTEGQVVAVRISVSMGLTANVIKLEPASDLAAVQSKIAAMHMVVPA